MTLREEFLNIKTREEYEKRKADFKELKPDRELLAHLDTLYPPSPNPDEELYKYPPKQNGE